MTLEIKRRASMVLASIVAVVFAMTALLAGAAQAEEEAPLGPGNIDPKVKGSITVHKLSNPGGTLQLGSGQESEIPTGAESLGGVEFTVTQITDIDLKVASEWAKLENLKAKSDGSVVTVDPDVPNDPGTPHALGTPKTVETNRKNNPDNLPVGQAVFGDLPVGVYVVVEGEDKGNEKSGDNNITAKAAPFLVTIPLKDTEWNYNVHVYPKNSVTEVTKTVDDTDAVKAGDLVKWTVTAKVPKGDDLKNFHVSDTFDSRLTPKKNPVDTGVYAKVITAGFEAGVDKHYTVEHVDGSQTVKVVFTDAGVVELNKIKGQNIEVEFYTEVNAIEAPTEDDVDGVIPNQATVFTQYPGQDGKTTDSDKPDTEWGELTIIKSDEDNTKKLSGAEFSVYLTEADAKAGKNAKAVIVTNENGVASVILKKRTYYVKETKAPAGYVLSTKVHEVTIDPDVPTSFKVKLELDNVKSDVPDLPLTGASGQLLMMVGGGAVILLAAGTGLVAIKRRRA